METVNQLLTLEAHQKKLAEIFHTARTRVVITSPFISIYALRQDGLLGIIKKKIQTGLRVTVYTDENFNMSKGRLKPAFTEGVKTLRSIGVEVVIVNGVHKKTLIRDNDLIAEGSFNWLSAVRTQGAKHQNQEATLVITGLEAESLIFDSIRMSENLNRIDNRGVTNMKTQPKKPATKVEKVIYIILGIIGTLVFPPIGVIIGILLIVNKETDRGTIITDGVNKTSNPMIDADHRCFSTNLFNDSRYSSNDD